MEARKNILLGPALPLGSPGSAHNLQNSLHIKYITLFPYFKIVLLIVELIHSFFFLPPLPH